MMGKTHKVGGAVSGFSLLTLAQVTSITINPIFGGLPFLAGNIIGALLPDIDQRKSTIGRLLWFISFPIWIIQSILNYFLRNSKSPLAKAIKGTVNHRGFAHWPIHYIIGAFICFLFLLISDINQEYLTIASFYNTYFRNLEVGVDTSSIMGAAIPLMIGMFLMGICFGALNHIFLDALNVQGVPLFAPFSLKKIPLGKIVTGMTSKKEKRLRFFLNILLFILAIAFIYLTLCSIDTSFLQENVLPLEGVDLIRPLN